MTIARNGKQEIISPLESPRTQNTKILYPLFVDCAQFTLDPYWQQVFEECSRGKFPRGSGIDSEGKIVYFRNRTSNNNQRNYISYKIKKNPKQIFKDLKQLFQDHLNFKSIKDRQEIRDELDDICKNLQESFTGSWCKIKRKKIKDPIIRRYILNLKKTHNLNDKETAEVAQIIKLGFLFNWISNDQVVYKDQQILDIMTLHFDSDDRSFNLEEPNTLYKREYKPKLVKLSTLWEKYIEKPHNRYML
uniref:Uncharacterized protein n=1 Tax=Marseillevirus LCMAC201 TaxID=2506605 RepID=A0A481YYS9_9VIRU|nr:MAG: uncharacterized protein LCMAC201_05290 [Marseillevirus LCMAC201]